MDYLLDALGQAFLLLRDPEVLSIAGFSLRLAAISTCLAALIGVPIGFVLGTVVFPGRRFITSIFSTLLSIPTVVIGLGVYSFISRRGPLGHLGLLFTPQAIIIGQTILALPIVIALTMNATRGLEKQLGYTALSMGASQLQAAWLLVKEARFAVLGAIMTAFGRVIAEVGAAMMLGGNIHGYTRTLTTAIALEVGKGEFAFALALGLVLLGISFIINIAINLIQGSR